MLALPYLTSNPSFNGTIYATEPTTQIGRKFMEELITNIKRGHHQELQSHDTSKTLIKALTKEEEELHKKY
ncbi:hypothetical protein AKO1_003253, partial [Acrasis kona]